MQRATIDRSKEWTVGDFLQLGEMSTPCELINGDLIMSPAPTPLHQTVSSNLNDLLKAEAKKRGDTVLYAPIDVFIDNKNVFQPDLIYITRQRGDIISLRGVEGAPDIIIEIVSPSSVFIDRNKKKRAYQNAGTREFWLVDPANKTLEIYLHDQADHDTPHLYLVEQGVVKSTVLPDLAFDLSSIFQR
jgi:Uma2 family endonuclease